MHPDKDLDRWDPGSMCDQWVRHHRLLGVGERSNHFMMRFLIKVGWPYGKCHMDIVKGELDFFISERRQRLLVDHEVFGMPDDPVIKVILDVKTFLFIFFEV